MKQSDIINLVINKLENEKNVADIEYSKGRLTHSERSKVHFFLDQVKYDLQKLMNSLTLPD